MPERLVKVGDRVHIITRRLFPGDALRHFAGEVTKVSGELQEVQGHAFVFNRATNEYERRPERRTRIFSFGQAGLIVNKIPHTVAIESLEYRFVSERLVVTDNSGFALDINEFGPLA